MEDAAQQDAQPPGGELEARRGNDRPMLAVPSAEAAAFACANCGTYNGRQVIKVQDEPAG